ncbi:tetratricopeptide repeat protein [Tardiphaga sp. vice304]|uniref:tetratricopeptide repeat protein n=1 Tax=Tardiphaga sp. vice304 TaxID=2592817 RepID=UPI00116489DD|nr:tetratricopeptide repeat protein [Tardiphaga sp. vice304]QDM26546.1 tetratricopeptide repeat protein [Tardiphaga sp. vice304]
MAGIAAAANGTIAGAWTRAVRRCAGLLLAVAAVLAGVAAPARAQAVRGEASMAVAGGYARIVLKLAEDVESEVTQAGTVLIVRFKRPVDVPVEALSDAAPEYIGSARRDPDGMAIRLALSRKVTVNSMAAGERIFIDLLPDSWKGLPPGLPQEVVKELSERARIAERALRQQRTASEGKKTPAIRVRASVQPTFVRFVFELPAGVGMSSSLSDKTMTLNFNAGLTFDLADAKLSAPPNIASIGQAMDGNRTAVEIGLIGDVDVRSFREDKNYIVDIGFQQPDKPSPLASLPVAKPEAAKPPVVARPVTEASPPRAGETMPPASESVTRETKPAEAAKVELPKVEPAKATPPKVELAKVEPAKVEAAKVEPAKAEPAKEGVTTPAPSAVVAAPVAEAAPAAAAAPAMTPVVTAEAPPAAAEPGTPVDVKRSSDGLRMDFGFNSPTPAALFRRGDMLWLVVDSQKPIDLSPIRRQGGSVVGDVSSIKLDKGQAIRIRLNRPQLASLTPDDAAGLGLSWSVMLADTRQTASQPLSAIRNIADPAHGNVQVPLSRPGLKHLLVDPEAGDALTVVTALPPPRGFIRRQDFVEFSLLETIHGVAIQLNSDEVAVEAAVDKVTLSRPGGLTLSAADAAPQRASSVARPIFDVGQWQKDQEGPFKERFDVLIRAASAADANSRADARMDLARFYMARGMYHEAKGVADLAISDMKVGQESPVALIVHAVASTMMGRPEQTLKDVANPVLGPGYDAELWKALAYARQEKWVLAREKFKNAELAMSSLPADLQRIALTQALRASLEVKDYAGASARGSELETVGVTPELKPHALFLAGWLDEALGRDKDALSKYQQAIASKDRHAASEAKLRDILLRQKRREVSDEDALKEFELLAMLWRGDGLEVQVLQILSRMYSGLGRFNESLAAARSATERQANSEAARQVQDDAQALFSEIYLGGKGDSLRPVDALAMFYDYRELTPIGRRGDEMIRRLADRLVAVDLLDQAAELLQYQVDNRLEGAARAQVASRLAMVYLMARKPDRAIAALRTTRIADLAGELRQQRLLLEARAQGDVGRRDLALDIISNIPGREAIRLRSDIYWSARRWREASEQIELYYGDRWRDFTPLNAGEKSDVIRAVVGYALAEDALGLARFRDKFAPLMASGADKVAFDTASSPASGSNSEFAAIAKMAASIDTLDGFLREMKLRFPEAGAKGVIPAQADTEPTGSLPAIVKVRKIEMKR